MMTYFHGESWWEDAWEGRRKEQDEERKEARWDAFLAARASFKAEDRAEQVWDRLRAEDERRTLYAMDNLVRSFTDEERKRIELLERCF